VNQFLQCVLNGIGSGAIYALIAGSFTIIYSTTRIFHFAHAAIFTVAAYLTYTFSVYLHLGLALSAVLSGIAAGFIGITMAIIVYEPLRKRAASAFGFIAASLGLLIVLQNLISLLFGDNVLILGEASLEGISILGARISSTRVLTSILAISLSVLLCCVIGRTRVGTTLRAMASNSDLAETSGLPLYKLRLAVFVVGSILMGIAGILVALDTQLKPDMGFYAFLMGVTGAIVGGIGRTSWAVAGGFAIGMFRDISVRPSGFLGKKMSKTTV